MTLRETVARTRRNFTAMYCRDRSIDQYMRVYERISKPIPLDTDNLKDFLETVLVSYHSVFEKGVREFDGQPESEEQFDIMEEYEKLDKFLIQHCLLDQYNVLTEKELVGGE